MNLESGALHVGGLMAYVPQTPWVQNLTLRDNITFGLPFDEDKYKKVGAPVQRHGRLPGGSNPLTRIPPCRLQVVHACALELDLQILPKGDQTMAGERGINLSGGQRQRVCLARAAYHDCDLILLDNPLRWVGGRRRARQGRVCRNEWEGAAGTSTRGTQGQGGESIYR